MAAELIRLAQRFGTELAEVDVLVEEVPPEDAGEVRLYRTSPATGGRPARLVVHRRPVESRARGHRAREDLVHAVVVEAVADLLGLAPEDVDPDHDGDLP